MPPLGQLITCPFLLALDSDIKNETDPAFPEIVTLRTQDIGTEKRQHMVQVVKCQGRDIHYKLSRGLEERKSLGCGSQQDFVMLVELNLGLQPKTELKPAKRSWEHYFR